MKNVHCVSIKSAISVYITNNAHIIALFSSLALHANCFVRLRNLGKACGVIVSAAAVTNKRGKSYKKTYSLKINSD